MPVDLMKMPACFTRLAFAILAMFPLSAAAAFGAPLPEGVVGPGERIVHDGRIWSCAELTAEDIALIGDRHLDTLAGQSAPVSASCLVKDENGAPALMRRRMVLGGSELLTYHDEKGEWTLQTWETGATGKVKTVTDAASGSSIQMPIIFSTYQSHSWKAPPPELDLTGSTGPATPTP